MSLQKNEVVKFCNCRNSKCMKLYCECFAARVECSIYCHCIDCHNRNNAEHLKIYKDYNNSERKTFKEELARQHKGCACRKSGCTKKYCQCYQAGLLCRDICKCIECQNNESLSNKKVISDLKRNTSSTSNKDPIILTQDNRHLNQILADQNPLNLQDEWIDKTAEEVYKKASEGSFSGVLQKLIDVLSLLQNDTLFHSEGEDFRNDPSDLRNEIQNEQKQEKQQLKFQNMDLEEIKRQKVFNQNQNSEPMDQQQHQSFSQRQQMKEEHNQ